MKKLSYIGFDLDGTLVDSHKAIYDCLKYTIPKYADIDVSKIIDTVFPLTLDQFPNYIDFVSRKDFLEFKIFFIESFDEIYYKKVIIIDGAIKTLDFCMNKYGNENIFILTNRRNKSAIQICNYLGITDIISTKNIYSTINDGSKNPKLNSMSNIVSKYSNSLEGYYVGDSAIDIESAISNRLLPLYISKKKDDTNISVFNLKLGYNLFHDIVDIIDVLEKLTTKK